MRTGSTSGRSRWGGDEEAAWGDYFNGSKDENPWVAHAPLERLPKEPRPIEIFGITIAHRESPIDVSRLFMARFGEIARIEARGHEVRVTLKSGTVFDLDRFSANDFDDGVRVWDGRRGVVNLDSLRIRTIELLPTARPGDAPYRLHVDFSPGGSGPAYGDFPPGRPLTGSVTTRAGRRLAGRLVYDLDESETTETLDAPSQGVDYTIPFGLIASIVLPGREERGAPRARVTLQNGEELQLERTDDLGEGNAGLLIFVDGRQRPEYVPLDRRRAGRLRPPAGDVPAVRRALEHGARHRRALVYGRRMARA